MASRETYKGQDVFYGEGGPHHDAKESKNLDQGDEWMRNGYYVSAWAIQRGSAVIGFPLYFKLDHDMHLPTEQRRKARINSAKYTARRAIDEMLNVGLLERYEGGILVPAHI